MDIEELAMLLDTMGAGDVSAEEFQIACDNSKKLKGLEDEQRLQLYGLYKQSTIGDVNVPKPMMLDIVGTAKWNAWKGFEGFPKNAAAKAYVYLIDCTLNGEEPYEKRSADESVFTGMGLSLSSMQYGEGEGDCKWTEEQQIFAAVTDGNLEELERLIIAGADVNSADQDEMTPLHYAVDRGLFDAATVLIQHSANVNAQNSDGETPLTLAVTCEHEELVRLLLEHGADKTLKGEHSTGALDIMNDIDNEQIKTLLLEK